MECCKVRKRIREIFYKVIVRENEYVVLQYRLTPQYHSAFLREHFIGPQNVMIIMSVIGAVAIIIIQSIRFGKESKADAACIRRNQTNKGSKSGI